MKRDTLKLVNGSNGLWTFDLIESTVGTFVFPFSFLNGISQFIIIIIITIIIIIEIEILNWHWPPLGDGIDQFD